MKGHPVITSTFQPLKEVKLRSQRDEMRLDLLADMFNPHVFCF